jgi:hypothetical protein
MRLLVTSLATTLLLISSAAQTTVGGQRPRVFISDSQSWETSGNAGGANGTFAAHSAGGARPQTAEIVKTFGERCPDVIVNNKPDKADYVVLLDHEGGKGLVKRDNKMAVFNKDGDSIVSHSTRSLGNAVKDACDAITTDWPSRAAKNATPSQPVQPSSFAGNSMPTSSTSKISVSSTREAYLAAGTKRRSRSLGAGRHCYWKCLRASSADC